MASNTYTAIYTTTLTGAASSINIPSITQSYTHLELVVNYGLSADADSRFTVNGDSTSGLYSYVNMRGNGSTANSGKASSLNYFQFGLGGVTVPTTLTSVAKYTFVDYSSTTKPKMILGRVGDAGAQTLATAGVWRNNNAITSITLTPVGANFLTGTTVSLYGILAEGASPAPKATGGAIYSDSTYYYHVFGASGTFTPLSSLSCDILQVAGGGGGGNGPSQIGSGGGGAGGLLYYASQSLSATGYTVTVGAGGAINTKGTDTSFTGLTASVGGGRGASVGDGTNINGGSGGGGAYSTNTSGGTATSGQGNNGGSGGTTAALALGGGGGGAGAVGGNANTATGGNAGNGGAGSSTFSSWGTTTGIGQNVSGIYYLAGGGGGGVYDGTGNNRVPGNGGNGGGGKGGYNWSGPTMAIAGTSNTGGGGGGRGDGDGSAAAAGGSGVVIVRYLKA